MQIAASGHIWYLLQHHVTTVLKMYMLRSRQLHAGNARVRKWCHRQIQAQIAVVVWKEIPSIRLRLHQSPRLLLNILVEIQMEILRHIFLLQQLLKHWITFQNRHL